MWLPFSRNGPNAGNYARSGGGQSGSSSGTPGQLIALVSYVGSDAIYSTTNVFPVDVDATNVAITFALAVTTDLLVRLTGVGAISNAGQNAYWGLREGSTTLGQSFAVGVAGNVANGSVAFSLLAVAAGTHTYKWAYGVTGGATVDLYHGPTQGPLTLEVWGAP